MSTRKEKIEALMRKLLQEAVEEIRQVDPRLNYSPEEKASAQSRLHGYKSPADKAKEGQKKPEASAWGRFKDLFKQKMEESLDDGISEEERIDQIMMQVLGGEELEEARPSQPLSRKQRRARSADTERWMQRQGRGTGQGQQEPAAMPSLAAKRRKAALRRTSNLPDKKAFVGQDLSKLQTPGERQPSPGPIKKTKPKMGAKGVDDFFRIPESVERLLRQEIRRQLEILLK